MKTGLILLLSLLIILVSCDTPTKGEIVYVNSETKMVDFKIVEFNDLEDPGTLDNPYFNFKSNVVIQDYVEYTQGNQPDNPTTVGEAIDQSTTEAGNTPRLRYFIEDGAIIPYSIKDTILLTLYYHLEQGILFFISHGLEEMTGRYGKGYTKMPIYFELDFKQYIGQNSDGSIKTESIKDNAMFLPGWNALAFFKQNQLKHLSLVLNPMVIIHEFSHAMFAYLAEGRLFPNDSVYLMMGSGSCLDQFNALSINEGFSDYWASVYVNNPEMFYLSMSEQDAGLNLNVNNDRSLNNNRVLDSSAALSTEGQCENTEYSPYWGGTIWASTLWEIYQKNEIKDFNKHLLYSYGCLADKFSKLTSVNTFKMTTPANCLVETLRKRGVSTDKIYTVCSVLKKRYPDDTLSGGLDACN